MTTTTETALASLGLTGEEIRAILNRAETRAFPRDVIIVKEGERSESLYVILEGRVKAFVVDPAGKETVLSTQGAGEYFGGMGFDEGPHPASIMTVEPSRLTVLPTSDFKVFLHRNSLFAVRVLEKLVHQVEEHARDLSEVLQQKTAIGEILSVISNSPTNVQ